MKRNLKKKTGCYAIMSKLFPPKFLAAKKAIKIIPMGVDDKAQPYLACSNLFRTQNCLT